MPIGVAVVGVGYWGPVLARVVTESPHTSLRWTCDLDPTRADRLAARHRARASTSLDDVLADPDVGAVLLATPPSTHAALTRQCLDADRHVLVEKPMALSSTEATDLGIRAERRGLTLMCDHTYCYAHEAEQVRRLISDGALGSLLTVRSTRASHGIVQRDVDVFWDLAAHDLAILAHLAPDWDPHLVSARGVDPLDVGHPCAGEVSIEARSGPHVTIAVSWLSPTKIRTIEIVGALGTITWNDLAPRRLRGDVPGLTTPMSDRDEPLHTALADFVQSIHHARSPVADSTSAVDVLRVLEAISRSARDDGLPVTVGTEDVGVDARQPA